MTGAPRLPIDPGELAAVCQDHGVARLLLFGSVMRPDFTAASDVDVLVEFAPTTRVGLMELARLQIALSEMLGRDVHLSTPASLSRYFREEILGTAVPVYVAA